MLWTALGAVLSSIVAFSGAGFFYDKAGKARIADGRALAREIEEDLKLEQLGNRFDDPEIKAAVAAAVNVGSSYRLALASGSSAKRWRRLGHCCVIFASGTALLAAGLMII